MKTGKGVVKKYSREYNRTLKNGEKKKYTTKQIQITIPKHDDIYEDKEEVLIIPQSEIEEFKNLEDKVSALEIANYIYTNEIETTPKVNVEAFENEINQLKQEKDQLLSTLENESSKLETLKEKSQDLRVKIDDIIDIIYELRGEVKYQYFEYGILARTTFEDTNLDWKQK